MPSPGPRPQGPPRRPHAALVLSGGAAAQQEGDANSPLVQWSRMSAEPGTFWLDSAEDREIIRYTTRDIRLCLPRPRGVGAADRGHALQVTWDGTNRAVLSPGNCLYFDARRGSLKPVGFLPRGVALKGSVERQQALR